METPRGFLVWTGAPGTGKTHFCAAMIEWLVTNSQIDEPDRKVEHWRYYKEGDLLKRVKEGIEYNWDSRAMLSELLDDYFIIIDDLGSNAHNEWREDRLFDAIDNRHESLKPTIITTNLTKNQIASVYHPRLADRLFDKSNCIIDTHDQESYRQRRNDHMGTSAKND